MQGWSIGRAKKITLIIEDEQGQTVQINFGGEPGRTIAYESAMNMEYATASLGTFTPMYQHVTKREFNLRVQV